MLTGASWQHGCMTRVSPAVTTCR